MLGQLERDNDVEGTPWIRLQSPDEDYGLDIASFRLPDQNVLQIGIGKGPGMWPKLPEAKKATFS